MLEKETIKITSRDYLRDNVMFAVGNGKKYHSLAELATAMGISASTLTHALKGNPRLDTIQKIADTLEVPVYSLFKQPITRSVEGYAIVGGKLMPFSDVQTMQNVLDEAKKPLYR